MLLQSQMKVQLDNLEIALISPAFSSFSLFVSSLRWEIACRHNIINCLTLVWSQLPGRNVSWRCWIAEIGNKSIMSIIPPKIHRDDWNWWASPIEWDNRRPACVQHSLGLRHATTPAPDASWGWFRRNLLQQHSHHGSRHGRASKGEWWEIDHHQVPVTSKIFARKAVID